MIISLAVFLQMNKIIVAFWPFVVFSGKLYKKRFFRAVRIV